MLRQERRGYATWKKALQVKPQRRNVLAMLWRAPTPSRAFKGVACALNAKVACFGRGFALSEAASGE